VTTVEMAECEHVLWSMLDLDFESACIKRPEDFRFVVEAGG
tara:strand:- start:361 stop:483 length:123 start_codon:yes stop_codon:yes gene_type:complete